LDSQRGRQTIDCHSHRRAHDLGFHGRRRRESPQGEGHAKAWAEAQEKVTKHNSPLTPLPQTNRSGLDKYARDARAWRDFAKINYLAAAALFNSGDPFLYFAAATLGHHALEMYLKAALIREGMTAFNPRKIQSLDAALGLAASDCVWGHNLVKLAEELSKRRSDFDLNAQINLPVLILAMPMTLREAFALFNPFFSELRYPQELKTMQGLGEEEKLVLDELIARLTPLLEKV
jgi:HEPN domain-containing protein